MFQNVTAAKIQSAKSFSSLETVCKFWIDWNLASFAKIIYKVGVLNNTHLASGIIYLKILNR